jgi:CMP-N-acetylneuraminic acid synthetase
MLQIVDNRFAGFFPDDPRPEYFNLPRQSFPSAYQPNGYVDICRSSVIEKTGQLYGPSILPFITDWSAEIDSIDDFELLEWQLSRRPHPLVKMVEAAARKD